MDRMIADILQKEKDKPLAIPKVAINRTKAITRSALTYLGRLDQLNAIARQRPLGAKEKKQWHHYAKKLERYGILRYLNTERQFREAKE